MACICDGLGFIPIGPLAKCHRCKGDGDHEGVGLKAVHRLWREIASLEEEINSQERERARNKKEPEPIREHGIRCHKCKGSGIYPTGLYGDLGIEKCRDCNGTGILGKAMPIVERLWYEINRLTEYINQREREWTSRMRDIGGFTSAYSNKRRENPDNGVRINDRDVWMHLLDINEATEDAVKRAYSEKAMVYHPDKGGNPRDFRMIKLARDKLLESIQ